MLPVRVEKSSDTNELFKNISLMLRQMTQKSDEVSYELKPLTGGITNVLYRATPSDGSEEFVVRFFGDGTEVFIDRSVENKVFAALSKAGLAPSFVGLFENGRVEGMLDCHNLSCEDMTNPVLIPYIARSVANLHKQNVDIDRSVDIWSKIGQFFDMAVEAYDNGKLPSGRGGDLKRMRDESIWLKRNMNDLLEKFKSDSKNSNDDASVFEYEKGCRFAFEKVMAHNDLLSGNILINNDYDGKSAPSITIIDFEYTCYNARAFDLANHFCEYAGFDFDIRNLFPNEDTRMLFYRNYAAQTLDTQEISPQFLKGLDMVTMRCTLISHLFWGSWAAVQASCSGIDFDFIGYCDLRLDGYSYHKTLLGIE